MTNIVIGAANGMGAEVARLLSPRGPLLLADLDGDRAARVARDLGGDVTSLAVDISDQGSVDALMAGIDHVDALVVTAGLAGAQAPGRRILEVNLLGTERVLRAVETRIGDGSVAVCFASLSGHRVPESPELMAALEDPLAVDLFERLGTLGIDVDDPQLAYSVSKRGVMRLVRRRAKPWGGLGARIVSLSPGSTDTEMSRQQQAATPVQAKIIEQTPFGRRGRPEEIAKVAVFLVSADASWMSGSDVLVDGGMATTVPTAPGG